jgi:hypothetical protein
VGEEQLRGLMASDDSHCRISIYWIEPYLPREASFCLRYSDFIVTTEGVHYWIHGGAQRESFRLFGGLNDPLLPRQESLESALRSALTILSAMRSQPADANVALEVGEFFRTSRGSAKHAREVLPADDGRHSPASSTALDAQILNSLPFGRKYSKEKRTDGTVVWRAGKLMDGRAIATVTVKPISGIEKDHRLGLFDPGTLGHWALLPEPYTTYWSLDLACSKLVASPDRSIASRELCDQIEFYLDTSNVPAQVSRALDRLRFKTALMTGDADRVRRSAQGAVARLCADQSVPEFQCLLQLGSMAGEIHKRYPQEAQEWLRPLVRQVATHSPNDFPANLDKLMATIDSNNWFMYGKLLVEEARSQSLVDENMANTLGTKLEALRLARDTTLPDPCESSGSVRTYLADLDADPPKGEIDLNDLRRILEKGLADYYTDAQSKARRNVVENIIASIRLVVGEGPFRGDPTRLIESVKRFSGLYLVVDKTQEPIDAALATLIALSFCDISTPQDHDLLLSQLHKLCAQLQSQVDVRLSERGLNSLVVADDVERAFSLCERIFREYLDDPLWPTFKFPLTENEEARLANTLRLRFLELEPLLQEMSLKVKYGGSAVELRQTLVREIWRAAQMILPEAAFLRRPSYPGVSCQYRVRYGFTIVIESPFYEEGKRPKEKFRAMKYFHLGHRLEETVKRERELTSLCERLSEEDAVPPREQEAVDHGVESPTQIE